MSSCNVPPPAYPHLLLQVRLPEPPWEQGLRPGQFFPLCVYKLCILLPVLEVTISSTACFWVFSFSYPSCYLPIPILLLSSREIGVCRKEGTRMTISRFSPATHLVSCNPYNHNGCSILRSVICIS